MSAKAAIVTTLRNVGPSLESFIAWHLGQGFSHLFLFFDDPADPDVARVAGNPAVSVILYDAALRRAWEKLPEMATFGGFIHTEVMARQVLNAALALELARARGLAWLLHIDADELFWPVQGSVPTHFAWAERQKTNAIKFWNYEAVPESDDIADPFAVVDLFKVPPALKPAKESRFHFYSNGKAAARLSDPGMRPRNVHDFDDPDAPTPPLASPAAFILHYACCGFENFWRKYSTLGKFADTWFDKTDIRAATGSSLHLEARDVVATGDRAKALEFYREHIAIEDGARAQKLIAEGALTRISAPRRFFES